MPKLWNIIKNIFKGFFLGFKDSFLGFFLVFGYDKASEGRGNLKRNRTVKDKVWLMVKLNSLVFGASSLIFRLLFLTAIWYLTSYFDTDDQSIFSVYVKPFCEFLFNALWLVPIFLIFKTMNSFWCQDLAYNAFWQKQGKPQPSTSIGLMIADMVFTTFVQLLFMLQGSIKNLPFSFDLPYSLMLAFEFLHISLLNSLYSFEYSWSYMGWSLDRRLSFIEKNWSYFLGFGFVPALAAVLLNSILWSGCLFAVLFPFYIISANEAVPFCGDTGVSLKLFMPPVYIASSCTKFVFKTKNRTSQTTNNKSFR